MAIAILEDLTLLDGHCMPGMQPELKQALLLEAAGRSIKDIGGHEHAGETTIESRLRTAGLEIGTCLASGRQANKPMRGYWTGRHIGDCLADEADGLRASG